MKLQQSIARATLSLTVLTCSATAHAQTLLRTVNGPAAGAQFGKACISVPDQNGDGVKDLIVGAPDFNGGRGAIYCVSGLYLATGGGVQTLWSLAPTGTFNEFGYAIADVGDITNDGVRDYLIGEPGHDTANTDAGAVRLVSGSSHAIVSTILGDSSRIRLGSAIAATGDVDGDGRSEVLIGAPGIDGLTTDAGRLYLVMGDSLLGSNSPSIGAVSADSQLGSNHEQLGASVVSGFANSGGSSLFVVGAPGHDDSGGVDVGRIDFAQVTPDHISTLTSYGFGSTIAGERLGSSLDAAHDYDGDGGVDILVGAPNSPNGSSFEVGRVVVLSGVRVVAQTPPYEIYAFSYGSVAPPVNHSDPDPNFHFGAAVHACADLNNDGVGEILVGAPGYFNASFTGWNFRGLVRIFSGATGAQLTSITGASTDHLGDGLCGTVGDLDGDGFREFVLAGSLSDVGGTDSGVLKCYRLFPLTPSAYCVGKLNSLGCAPSIGFSGSPSASSSSPFLINAAGEINQKNGLLFYGHAPTSVLFQGGTLCVASPTSRTALQNSGGSASGADCSGSYSFDFNPHTQSGLDPTLVAGAEVFAQYWARDPASLSTTSLSNALRLLINP